MTSLPVGRGRLASQIILGLLVYLAIAASLVVATMLAGAPPEASSEEKKDKTEPDAEKKADEQIRRDAERVVRGIDLEIFSDDKWSKVERIEKPLLFYGEPTRNNDRGSVWGWGKKGRPVALLELWQHVSIRTRWFFAICNTSGGRLRARWADAPWWEANDSEAELKDIPGAAAPAADSPLRQRQLKLLAQKFMAHEFWEPNNSRFELRLLKRSLHTYRDEAKGLLDGGLFTLANGTNPEIMLFVEARADPKDKSKRVWQFTVGRSAHAELHMAYNGKEVFEAPRGYRVSASNKPYWLGNLEAALDADSQRP